jgi:beta-phosphoglucomutase-like phosphatase (HAD superfamily)
MAKKIAERKAEIYEELLGGRQPAEMLEAQPCLELLHRYDIPAATASALPEKRVMAGLNRHGLKQHFGNIITAEDGGATEIEW